MCLNSTLFGSLSSNILAKWPSHFNLLWLTVFETFATLHQPGVTSFPAAMQWHVSTLVRLQAP